MKTRRYWFDNFVDKIGSDDVICERRHTGRYGNDKSMRERSTLTSRADIGVGEVSGPIGNNQVYPLVLICEDQYDNASNLPLDLPWC